MIDLKIFVMPGKKKPKCNRQFQEINKRVANLYSANKNKDNYDLISETEAEQVTELMEQLIYYLEWFYTPGLNEAMIKYRKEVC